MAKVQKGTGKTEFCLQGIGHGKEYEYVQLTNKHTKSMSLVTLTEKVYCLLCSKQTKSNHNKEENTTQKSIYVLVRLCKGTS